MITRGLREPKRKLESDSSETPSLGEVHEGSLAACLIGGEEHERIWGYQELRHDYFVRERKWVRDDPEMPGRETDRYDAHCHQLGVFKGGLLAAYLRVLPGPSEIGFMLENEFRILLGVREFEDLGGEGTAELSRLVVRRDPGFFTCLHERQRAVELLLKLLYRLSLSEGYRRFYIVVERKWLPFLGRRFLLPFEPVGRAYTFPDGTETVAARADLSDMEERMRRCAPERFEWYRSG